MWLILLTNQLSAGSPNGPPSKTKRSISFFLLDQKKSLILKDRFSLKVFWGWGFKLAKIKKPNLSKVQ